MQRNYKACALERYGNTIFEYLHQMMEVYMRP